MTAGAFFGASLILALALVLAAVALRALSRYVRAARLDGATPRMEVLGRVGLGPRQGLAVVRVGDRAVVVSVGEGGVRPVMELDAAETAALAEEGADPVVDFFPAVLRARLARGVRTALVLLGVVAALGVGAGAAEAAQVAGQQTAADPTSLLPPVSLQVGGGDEGLRLHGTVGTVVVIGLLTLLPTLLLMTTSFTRILVVLHFLRQAIGTQTAPPGHLLAALALLLTGFVMGPTFREMNEVALRPWVEGQINEGEMLEAATPPLREFMLRQISEAELGAFLDMAGTPTVAGPEEVPMTVLMAAFATSELKKAFQIGFAIFLPFVVIDLVVAAVLTSMGMFMLPPTMVALPLKLMLFVLVDGWSLIVQSLVAGFQ